MARNASDINGFIASVRACRERLILLEASRGSNDLTGRDMERIHRMLSEAREQDIAARAALEQASGIRLAGNGRWLEPVEPDALRARLARLERHLPPRTQIDKRGLWGGRLALVYEALAPVPLVTSVDRARGRARAEVRS